MRYNVVFVRPNISDVAYEVKRDRVLLTAGSNAELQVSHDKQNKIMNSEFFYSNMDRGSFFKTGELLLGMDRLFPFRAFHDRTVCTVLVIIVLEAKGDFLSASAHPALRGLCL